MPVAKQVGRTIPKVTSDIFGTANYSPPGNTLADRLGTPKTDTNNPLNKLYQTPAKQTIPDAGLVKQPAIVDNTVPKATTDYAVGSGGGALNNYGMPGVTMGKTIGLGNIKDAKLKGADSLGALYGNYNYDPAKIKDIFTGASNIQGKEGINAAQGVLNSSDQGYTQQMALARAAAEKERNSAVMSGASSGMQALAGMDTRAKADQAFANTRLEALQGIRTAQDKAASLNAKASTDAFAASQSANEKLMATDSANYAVDASTQQAKLGYDAQVNAANTAGSASANNAYGNVKSADITGAHNENAASITGNATLGAADLNAQSYMYAANKNFLGNEVTANAALNGAKYSANAGLLQAITDKKYNFSNPTDVASFNQNFGAALGFELPTAKPNVTASDYTLPKLGEPTTGDPRRTMTPTPPIGSGNAR
jgi:hypothetical protein